MRRSFGLGLLQSEASWLSSAVQFVLIFRCPTTGARVSSGVNTGLPHAPTDPALQDADTLPRLRQPHVSCRLRIRAILFRQRAKRCSHFCTAEGASSESFIGQTPGSSGRPRNETPRCMPADRAPDVRDRAASPRAGIGHGRNSQGTRRARGASDWFWKVADLSGSSDDPRAANHCRLATDCPHGGPGARAQEPRRPCRGAPQPITCGRASRSDRADRRLWPPHRAHHT